MKYSGIALCLWLLSAGAQAACLNFDQDGAVLRGKVSEKTFYGPPNFGETPRIDAKEKQAILLLDSPICVQNADGSGLEKEQREVTLVPLDNAVKLKPLMGKKVEARGKLFSPITIRRC